MPNLIDVINKELVCTIKNSGSRFELLFMFPLLLILPLCAFFLNPFRPGFDAGQWSNYSMALRGYLMIFTFFITALVARETFAGEKQNRTLEKLLSLPISDKKLFSGKLISIFLISCILVMVDFFVISLAIWGGGIFYGYSTEIFSESWLLMGLFLAPVVSLYGASATVILSLYLGNEKSVEHASVVFMLPLAPLIILPLLNSGMLTLDFYVYTTVLIVAIDVILLMYGVLRFQRDKLLEKMS
jgi:ABC-2 type transport system permease protein